jgi:hypothetical protein
MHTVRNTRLVLEKGGHGATSRIELDWIILLNCKGTSTNGKKLHIDEESSSTGLTGLSVLLCDAMFIFYFHENVGSIFERRP